MVKIAEIHKKVPLMFRAQTAGRCQLNYLARDTEPDVKRWTSEWIEKATTQLPSFNTGVQTKTYTINWRFVTNAGQDDGIIRPVIGAKGIPFYPGSSMKGAFSRACTPQQRERYCGKDLGNGDFTPGILRFEGGYPTDNKWQEKLIDIVHPQQSWQVKSQTKEGGAFPMISLYKPTLIFGISSPISLEESEWETIWKVWEKALSRGIGCRVSAGYGQPKKTTQTIIYATDLKGEGIASKLLDGTAEFRPNLFKATLRGHALRIFGGLTDPKTAERAVEQLFGGTEGEGGTVGLLTMKFRDTKLDLDTFGSGRWAVYTYDVEGRLSWLLNEKLTNEAERTLGELIQFLLRFAMVLGGFGRSWRRSDHRLFYPDYYKGNNKPLIGCHWQWQGEALIKDVSVGRIDHLGSFIDKGLEKAKNWLKLQGLQINTTLYAKNWRESWHPDKVQVWGRLAEEGQEDSLAIYWLHRPYQKADPYSDISQGQIYHTSVTGSMGQVGYLWHRMYPLVRLSRNPDNSKKATTTFQYLEFLTIFPDGSQDAKDFLVFLNSSRSQFQKLWPVG